MAKTAAFIDKIIVGDCVAWLNAQAEPFADLIFADPPFNIGYKYDLYKDSRRYDEYHAWTREWMEACQRVLKPTGSFWVAIGDDYAAEVCLIGKDLRLHLRNWVIWHYTFGQSTQRKFARSHTHLFYWTKHPTHFTFNTKAVAVLSDRQKEYRDKRAAALGRVPHDVWTDFPRVCGTFSERQRWHPCQMPEGVLARIIRACSRKAQVVFDPFAGSGTTLVVAKKLGRRFLGIELSSTYASRIEQRLRRTEQGTAGTRRPGAWPVSHIEQLGSLYVENGIPSDQLRRDPTLWHAFVQQFNGRMENLGLTGEYEHTEVWDQLERMRKSGRLGRIKVHAPVRTTDDYPAPVLPFAGPGTLPKKRQNGESKRLRLFGAEGR